VVLPHHPQAQFIREFDDFARPLTGDDFFPFELSVFLWIVAEVRIAAFASFVVSPAYISYKDRYLRGFAVLQHF
jgi:hypothetical protein